ncbi:PAS domain-containing protein [Isoalcanivorax indicus]|uniref:PAS domain-containing protein n=1 Tax=Isoalcanivorax indicus TaxID=2202653 RepID=UPI000DB9BBBD|nr:PAS domain-containing protein [Isoalcanivorax indicus]
MLGMYLLSGSLLAALVALWLIYRRRANALRRQHAALLTLNRISSLGADDLDARLRNALDIGRRYLDLDNGIISHVHNGEYRLVTHSSDQALWPSGQMFPLSETYCSIILEQRGIWDVSHTRRSRYASHPAYAAFGLEAYIGIPVIIEGRAYGTLAFFSRGPRRRFTKQEREFVSLMANWVAAAMALRLADEKHRGATGKLEKMANNVPGLVYQYVIEADGSGHFPYVSSGLYDTCGLTPDALRLSDQAGLGRIHPDDLDFVRTSTEASRKSLTPMRHEFRFFHPRKGMIWLEDHANPEPLSNGAVLWHGFITDVSERKRMELALQEETRRLQSIIDGTAIGTWEWHIQANTLQLNARWAEMLGHDLSELSPMSRERWMSLIHPEDQGACEAALNHHVRGQTQRYEFQYRMRHKAGHWIWVHDRGQIMTRSSNGEPVVMFGTHADITKSIATQEALAESEARFRSILSRLPGTVYRCRHDRARTLHYVSERISDLSGFKADELERGHRGSLNQLIVPEDTGALEGINEALLRKRPYEIFYRIRHKDGSLVWIQDKGSLTLDTRDGTQWLDGFMWDVTDKRLLTEQLAESEQRFEGAFETAPQGMAIIRASGEWLDMNTALCRLLGFKRSELMGHDCRNITHPEDRDEEQARTEALLRGDLTAFQIKKRMLHKFGHEIWVLQSMSLVYDAEDQPSYMVSIIQDISEEMRSDILKRNFVSTVSHELRTPLTAIFGSLGLVTQGALGEVPAEMRRVLTIAYNNSERLILLINDLLDMEKLISGKMDITGKPLPLAPMLREAVEANKSYADKYSVHFTLEHIEPATVQADGARFQQVMANLLSNAAKFSHAGRDVVIRAQCRGHEAIISVQDSGEGIPSAFHARVFDKFTQADSSDIKHKGGTGLGLAISRELVEKMDGRIWFDSTPGQGSTFYVALPLAKVNPADTSPASP